MLLRSYLDIDGVINFKIYLPSSPGAMADSEKKNGRMGIQKFEYLQNEKSFMDKVKKKS